MDLLPPAGATPSPASVQRDYGFWCPRELKIDPELGYSFMGVRDCSPPCPNMYFSREELSFARCFIGVASIVCLSATLFTFLTFLIDVSRFRYPERPIIFYAVCYMMVSLVFFLGFLLEDAVSCNAAVPGNFRASTVTQGSHNKVRSGPPHPPLPPPPPPVRGSAPPPTCGSAPRRARCSSWCCTSSRWRGASGG